MDNQHPPSGDADVVIQDGISEATFNFTIGDSASAIAQLRGLVESHPGAAAAWHALAEILLAEKAFAESLEAGEKAHSLLPDDIHINVTLSRIWVEIGDKEKAEHFGAQARMLGWKQELAE
jgi:cytochrome c-type biogenesis protein CcmH/NrfG